MLSRRALLLNLWYLFAIAAGLFFAWREGASAEALVFAALCIVAAVCVVLSVMAVVSRRKHSP